MGLGRDFGAAMKMEAFVRGGTWVSGQLPFTTKNVSDFQKAPARTCAARFDFRQFPFMDFLNLQERDISVLDSRLE